MKNRRHCAVCQHALEFSTKSRIVDDHDTSEELLGSANEWQEEKVVVGIHCPKCDLLYRVNDPYDLD